MGVYMAHLDSERDCHIGVNDTDSHLSHSYPYEVGTSEFSLEERPLRRILKILCAILTAPC